MSIEKNPILPINATDNVQWAIMSLSNLGSWTEGRTYNNVTASAPGPDTLEMILLVTLATLLPQALAALSGPVDLTHFFDERTIYWTGDKVTCAEPTLDIQLRRNFVIKNVSIMFCPSCNFCTILLHNSVREIFVTKLWVFAKT
jgi:hypothetical protein